MPSNQTWRRTIQRAREQTRRELGHGTRVAMYAGDSIDVGLRELKAERAKTRRARERAQVAIVEGALRSYRAIPGKLIPRDIGMQRHRHVTASMVLPGTEWQVAQWRRHIQDLTTTHRIEATFTVIANANGYSFQRARSIEISPITNTSTYYTALHEVGHVLRPCEGVRNRPVRPDPASKRTVCVRCEIEATRWAMAHAVPRWSTRMHLEMAHALRTYAKHGTPIERREIESLVSRWPLAIEEDEHGPAN